MTIRRVTAFIDALVHNRRPPTFNPDAEDADAMRAAIELRAAQPGATIPSSDFVADLRAPTPSAAGHARPWRRPLAATTENATVAAPAATTSRALHAQRRAAFA